MSNTPPADRFATRAADEAARLAAFQAHGQEWHVEARDDPAAGLAFILNVAGPTTVVAIHPGRGNIQARWLDQGTLPEAAAWAVKRSEEGFNLYWTPNLPTQGLARKPAKADVRELRALWADVDGKAGRTLGQAQAAVLALPEASFIIASGGGFQPVWLLDAPLPAASDTIAEAEAVGRRLAAAAHGDPVQSVDHILRLPFTLNYPNATKQKAGRVVCVSGLVRRPLS